MQNMKTKTSAIGTAENELRSAKHAKLDPTPSVPSKMCLAAQNMKIGLDALGTVENESESVKHENRTRHPRYRRK
jgi:hypothetical protein